MPGFRKLVASPAMMCLNCTRSKKNGSSRTPANTVMPWREAVMGVSPLLTRTVAVSGPSMTRLVAPVTDGAAGPRKCITWFPPVPVTNAWITRSSTASPLLSIFHWYSTLGSKKVVLASGGGMKPDTVIARTTLSGLTGLRNVYTSAMSAAGSAASSALSLWSDALIHRVTPSAAAVASSRPQAITRPRDRGAIRRSMVHSSWRKRNRAQSYIVSTPVTGVRICRGLFAARELTHEEWLLGRLRRAADRLLGHRGHVEGDERRRPVERPAVAALLHVGDSGGDREHHSGRGDPGPQRAATCRERPHLARFAEDTIAQRLRGRRRGGGVRQQP